VRRRLARTLEVEAGVNDPVAVVPAVRASWMDNQARTRRRWDLLLGTFVREMAIRRSIGALIGVVRSARARRSGSSSAGL